MSNQAAQLDEIVAQALTLSPLDKVRLVERVIATLGQDLQAERKPRRPLLGALAHLGHAPTTEAIDQARSEAWENFPREDIE